MAAFGEAGFGAGGGDGGVGRRGVGQLLDGLGCAAQLFAAGSAVDYFIVAALCRAGSGHFVLDHDLAGSMIQLGDGLGLAAQFLTADGAVDYFIVAALLRAGGGNFVFTYRLAGSVRKLLDGHSLAVSVGFVFEDDRRGVYGLTGCRAGSRRGLAGDGGLHRLGLAADFAGEGGGGGVVLAPAPFRFAVLMAQGLAGYRLGLSCERRVGKGRGIGLSVRILAGRLCGSGDSRVDGLRLEMGRVMSADAGGGHTAVIVGPNVFRLAVSMAQGRDLLLRYDNFAADRAVAAFREAGCGAGGIYRRVGHHGVRELGDGHGLGIRVGFAVRNDDRRIYGQAGLRAGGVRDLAVHVGFDVLFVAAGFACEDG